jgi:hypothetical protein
MASCGTSINDFFDNGLEPDSGEDGSEVTNMARDVLCTGIMMLTCLKQERISKTNPRRSQIKSSGKKILEYMQLKGFSGFRESWQRRQLRMTPVPHQTRTGSPNVGGE